MSVHARNGLALLHQRAREGEEPLLSSSLAELLRLAEGESAEAKVSFLEWALRIPEPKAGTLDFGRFPFQRELYELLAEDTEAVIKKSTSSASPPSSSAGRCSGPPPAG